MSCCDENIQHFCFKKTLIQHHKKSKFNGANNCIQLSFLPYYAYMTTLRSTCHYITILRVVLDMILLDKLVRLFYFGGGYWRSSILNRYIGLIFRVVSQ